MTSRSFCCSVLTFIAACNVGWCGGLGATYDIVTLLKANSVIYKGEILPVWFQIGKSYILPFNYYVLFPFPVR